MDALQLYMFADRSSDGGNLRNSSAVPTALLGNRVLPSAEALGY